MEADELNPGSHVGTWWFRNRWASALTLESGGDRSRRASLVESEFSLRWVALDTTATWVLCRASGDDKAAAELIQILRSTPSIGDLKPAKKRQKEALEAVDRELDSMASNPQALEFTGEFAQLGQLRSQVYESAIAKRLGIPLSNGLSVWRSIKPDFILEEYEPCAVTGATSSDDKAIELAIKRGCHVIELTAHLQADMRGLDDYLGHKVQVYAALLESV